MAKVRTPPPRITTPRRENTIALVLFFQVFPPSDQRPNMSMVKKATRSSIRTKSKDISPGYFMDKRIPEAMREIESRTRNRCCSFTLFLSLSFLLSSVRAFKTFVEKS